MTELGSLEHPYRIGVGPFSAIIEQLESFEQVGRLYRAREDIWIDNVALSEGSYVQLFSGSVPPSDRLSGLQQSLIQQILRHQELYGFELGPDDRFEVRLRVEGPTVKSSEFWVLTRSVGTTRYDVLLRDPFAAEEQDEP